MHGTLTGRIFWLVLVLAFLFSIAFVAHYIFSGSESATSPKQSLPAEVNLRFMPGVEVGIVDKKLINEVSGVVASRKNNGVLWVHNDSGDSPNIYAIKPDGEFIGTFHVKKAKNRDWEDIAIGPGPEKNKDYIYIGNIGDNDAKHSSIFVYRVEEPNTAEAKKSKDNEIGPADTIELVYPDGAKNAETLLVDPLTKDIYIITKGSIFSMVYMAPFPQDTEKKNTMEFVATISLAMATGGDVSPDGKSVIVRSARLAGLWDRTEDKLWKAFKTTPEWLDLMNEPQGEAICFDAEGKSFYTIGEMKHPGIYYYIRLSGSAKPKQQNGL